MFPAVSSATFLSWSILAAVPLLQRVIYCTNELDVTSPIVEYSDTNTSLQRPN